MAAGVFYVNTFKNTGTDFGITYVLGTIGNNNYSATVGAGWGFSDEHFSERPIIIFGGELKISRGFKFITENFFIYDSVPVMMIGIRTYGKTLAADFSMVKPLYGTSSKSSLVPWFNITYNFSLFQNPE